MTGLVDGYLEVPSGTRVSWLGISAHGLVTEPPLRCEFSLAVEVFAPDVGRQGCIGVSGLGRIEVRAGVAAGDVRVVAAWKDLLEWLHDPQVLLGHLIASQRCEVGGDLIALSAVEGVVSAPAAHGRLAAEDLAWCRANI